MRHGGLGQGEKGHGLLPNTASLLYSVTLFARSKMQNAENAREHLRPRTSPSSFMKHSSGEGASICSSQRGLVGVAQHRNAVCLFALRTWQSRRASGCSVTPESPVVQGSACGRLHCANTSGSTNCRQRLLSLSERRHGIAIGAGLHALVPVDAGATEVSAEASRGNARCKPQALRIRCSETADIPAHLCRHRLRFLGFAHPKQAVGRAESTLLACAGAAHERTALPLATSTGEDVRCGACQAARRERRSPTTKLAPDRQPLGRVIGRKRSHSRQLTGNTCKVAAIGLTACVACNCCCLSPVRSSPTFRLHFAFFGAAFWYCTI